VGEVLDTIRALQREGMTMLIVSHEMAFIREVASKASSSWTRAASSRPARRREIFDAPQSPRLKDFTSRILRH
jgi:polar amino acid transport system ATP-binding protein